MKLQTANKVVVLNSQQISKKTELDELLNNHMSLVETKGTEMSELLSKLDEAEEEKAAILKEVARIEAATRKLQDEKENLVPKIREKDEKLKKIQEKKNRLEKFLDVKGAENKNAKDQLERELEEIKNKIDNLRKVGDLSKVEPESQNLRLNWLEDWIEAKEKELECPVCLEVASVPIYCCAEQHMICCMCRPKVKLQSCSLLTIVVFQVSVCPECRDFYPKKPMRHRFAEKALEELSGLKQERARIAEE